MFALVTGLLSACGSVRARGSGDGGPYLSPGPLPPVGGVTGDRGGAVPAIPASLAGVPASRQTARPAAGSGLPAGLVVGDGLGRLPGALVAGVGPVHGLAVSVSLTGRAPSRDENALITDVLGGPGDNGATIARALDAASGGKFRLTFSSLPGLVAAGAGRSTDIAALRELAVSSLRSWTGQIDLSGFDNDGADGLAASPDDDGIVDFFLLAVEANQEVPSVTLRQGVPVVAGRQRELSTGPIHVLGLGAAGADPLLTGIGLVLDAAGLDGGERFFPSGFPRMISSLARVRLGWVTTTVLRPSGTTAPVPAGEAWLIPLRDMPEGAGFWLVENDGRSTFATRAVRTTGDHFTPTDVKVWQPGTAMVLPLSRQLGDQGERVVLQGPGSPELLWAGVKAAPVRDGAVQQPLRW